MNVFSSNEALRALASAHGAADHAGFVEARVAGQSFRTISIDGAPVLSHRLIDFFEPVEDTSEAPVAGRFVPRAAVRTVPVDGWAAVSGPENEPAPTIRWRSFADWAAFERSASSHQKTIWSDSRRRTRKLAAEVGPVAYVAHDPDPEAWDRCLQWKAEQYARTGAPSTFNDPEVTAYLDAIAGSGLTRVSTLRAGDDLVAVHIGLHHEGRWYSWFPAFDRAYDRYAPGRLLLHEMLRTSFDGGDDEFDFLFGDEGYKWTYATHVRVVEPLGVPSVVERARLLRKSLPRKYPAVGRAGRAAVQRARKLRTRVGRDVRRDVGDSEVAGCS